MEWIRNLKIGNKLLVLIAISLFFIIVTGLIGFYYTNSMASATKTLYNDRVMPIVWFSDIRSNFKQARADVLELILSKNESRDKLLSDELTQLSTNDEALFGKYEQTKLDPFEVTTVAKYKDAVNLYRSERHNIVSLVLQNKNQQAYNLYMKNQKTITEVENIVQSLAEYNRKVAENLKRQSDLSAKVSIIIISIAIFTSFSLLMLIGLMISKMITLPITRAVGDLEEGATQVAAASEQLSAASEQLAQGSAEQAAAIQETSASIEESDSMVKQNTENTEEAARLAKQARDFAQGSNVEMEKMVVSMEELKQSSDEIAKIIKVIDEIAFQTNILALNAAVEAARAGDAGKGFAVVAEEVRNLAQKSAQATKDTAKIIERNVHLSNNSSEVTQKINEDIKEITVQAQKVSDLLNEIAVASEEQAKGIEQIDKAIQQMEQVLQSNASTAEESASASHELSSQAENVKEIVNTLYVMVEGQGALNKKLVVLK